MAGLVPAIHVFLSDMQKGVDARDKCGHDGRLKLVTRPARLATTPRSATRHARATPSPQRGEGWGEGAPSLNSKRRSPSPSLVALARPLPNEER
jgi:hypothetical protein